LRCHGWFCAVIEKGCDCHPGNTIHVNRPLVVS
jgi:hypothetical protein